MVEITRLSDLDFGKGMGSSVSSSHEIRPMAELGGSMGVSGVERVSGEIKGLGAVEPKSSDIKGMGAYRRDENSCPPGCVPSAGEVIGESKDEKIKKLEAKLGVAAEKAEELIAEVQRRREAHKMRDVFGQAGVEVVKPKKEGIFERIGHLIPHKEKEPKPGAFEGTGIEVV